MTANEKPHTVDTDVRGLWTRFELIQYENFDSVKTVDPGSPVVRVPTRVLSE